MQQLATPQQAAHWLHSQVSGTLTSDSRQVRPGDGFMAWPGLATDGRNYVAAALAQGASACLVEQQDAEGFHFDCQQVACYLNLKQAGGAVASAYFDEPSRQLAGLAITGTNGKTSTAWWLAQALTGLQQDKAMPCGLIGTLGVGQPPSAGVAAQLQPFGLTTPDPVQLQRYLREFVTAGLQACAIEASSIGIEQQRLAATHIHSAVFTNLSQDHLDYHGSMQDYWSAKAALFQWPGLKAAVINLDDEKGAELVSTLTGGAVDVWTYSVRGPARLQAQDARYGGHGLQFTVRENEQAYFLKTRLIGQFNLSNLLAVMGAMRSVGVPLADAVQACANLLPVPGRMECFGASDQTLVAVDYAHTPDALAQALLALRGLAEQRGGQLWCVFGCGGDRDASKRALMGAMAANYADRVVVTSDNPRSEKPQAIISQILLGLTGHSDVTVQADRGLAIQETLAASQKADVVLIAGKGHETYQEIAGHKLSFSDAAQVWKFLSQQSATASQGLV